MDTCSEPKRIRLGSKQEPTTTTTTTTTPKTFEGDILNDTYLSVIIKFLTTLEIFFILRRINKQVTQLLEGKFIKNQIQEKLTQGFIQFKKFKPNIFHIEFYYDDLRYDGYEYAKPHVFKINCWQSIDKYLKVKIHKEIPMEVVNKLIKNIYDPQTLTMLYKILMIFPLEFDFFIKKLSKRLKTPIEYLHVYSGNRTTGVKFFFGKNTYIGRDHLLIHLWVNINSIHAIKIGYSSTKNGILEYMRRLKIFKKYFDKTITKIDEIKFQEMHRLILWKNIESTIGFWLLQSDEIHLQYLKYLIEFVINDLKIYKWKTLSVTVKENWCKCHSKSDVLLKRLNCIQEKICPLNFQPIPQKELTSWKTAILNYYSIWYPGNDRKKFIQFLLKLFNLQ